MEMDKNIEQEEFRQDMVDGFLQLVGIDPGKLREGKYNTNYNNQEDN